jgi:hypothetical protein
MAKSMHKLSVQEAGNIGLGQAGSTYMDDGDSSTASTTYNAITMINDTTFSTLTDAGRDGSTLTSVAIPKGITIFGEFTAITVSTGKCIAYKGA